MIDSVAYSVETISPRAIYDPGTGADAAGNNDLVSISDDTGRGNDSTVLVGRPEFVPAGGSTILRLVYDPDLPDAGGSDTGKGPLVTGIAYDDALNCVWLCNGGTGIISAGGARSQSVVQLSKDLSTKLSEIDVRTLYSMTDSDRIQGILVDPTDNTLWFACATDSRIYHMTKAGVDIGDEITFASVNTLAYQASTDNFIVGDDTNGGVLTRINKSGVTQATLDLSTIVSSNNIDHADFDDDGYLCVSFGPNDGTGTVVRIDISDESSPVEVERFPRDLWDAIEGIAFGGGLMYVANDGYAHETTSNRNSIRAYKEADMPAGIAFGGADAVTLADTSDLEFDGDSNLYIVVAAVADGFTGNALIAKMAGTSAIEYRFGTSSNAAGRIFANHGSATSARAGNPSTFLSPDAGDPFVATMRSNATVHFASCNGVEGTQATSGSSTTSQAAMLGAGSNGSGGLSNAFDGTGYRWYIFEGEPSEADQQRVQAEAAQLVGINDQLPRDNPFRLFVVETTNTPTPPRGTRGIRGHRGWR